MEGEGEMDPPGEQERELRVQGTWSELRRESGKVKEEGHPRRGADESQGRKARSTTVLEKGSQPFWTSEIRGESQGT